MARSPVPGVRTADQRRRLTSQCILATLAHLAKTGPGRAKCARGQCLAPASVPAGDYDLSLLSVAARRDSHGGVRGRCRAELKSFSQWLMGLAHVLLKNTNLRVLVMPPIVGARHCSMPASIRRRVGRVLEKPSEGGFDI